MTAELAPGVPACPAPWNCDGEGWIFPIYTPLSKTPIPLPKGCYSDFEAGTKFDQTERFHGGVGMVMIIRYNSTDVGPYDEMMYIPGLFSKEEAPTKYELAVTRIYVSSDASVANGRANWGIPKHRADFSFTRVSSSPSKTLVTLSHPTTPATPFFRAVLSNSKLTPFALPVSTSWLDWRLSRWLMSGYRATLVQPPLSSSADLAVLHPDKLATAENVTGQNPDTLTGTAGKSLAISPRATGWSRLACIEVAPPPVEGVGGAEEDWSGFGDGKSFPTFEVTKEGPIAGRGVHLPSFEMVFPEAVEVK
ncbi:hypothetical protein JCM5296_007117 [Sporobolomyces johnsonii]